MQAWPILVQPRGSHDVRRDGVRGYDARTLWHDDGSTRPVLGPGANLVVPHSGQAPLSASIHRMCSGWGPVDGDERRARVRRPRW